MMKKTKIKNIETGVEKDCDILRKNDELLEIVIDQTTIKILLRKKKDIYIGTYKDMQFTSTGN